MTPPTPPSGPLIIAQTFAVVAWVAANLIGFADHWDPYPFILLNLPFSTRAAYAAPLILPSQNRQSDTDRFKAQHDYRVNQLALGYPVTWHRDVGHSSARSRLGPRQRVGAARPSAQAAGAVTRTPPGAIW